MPPPHSSEKDNSKPFNFTAKSLYDHTDGTFVCAASQAQFSVDTNGNVQGTNNWNAGAAQTFAKVTINQALRNGWDPTNLNGTGTQLKSVCRALLREGMTTPVKINDATLKPLKPKDREQLIIYQALINNAPAKTLSNAVSDAAATITNISQFEKDIDVSKALGVLVRNKEALAPPQEQAKLFTELSKEPMNMSEKDFLKAMPTITRDQVKALIDQRNYGNEHQQNKGNNPVDPGPGPSKK